MNAAPIPMGTEPGPSREPGPGPEPEAGPSAEPGPEAGPSAEPGPGPEAGASPEPGPGPGPRPEADSAKPAAKITKSLTYMRWAEASGAQGEAALDQALYETLKTSVTALVSEAQGEVHVDWVCARNGIERPLPVFTFGDHSWMFVTHLQCWYWATLGRFSFKKMTELIERMEPSDSVWLGPKRGKNDLRYREHVTVYNNNSPGKVKVRMPDSLAPCWSWVSRLNTFWDSGVKPVYQRSVVVVRLTRVAPEGGGADLEWALELAPHVRLIQAVQLLETEVYGKPVCPNNEVMKKRSAMARALLSHARLECPLKVDYIAQTTQLMTAYSNPGLNEDEDFIKILKDHLLTMETAVKNYESKMEEGLNQAGSDRSRTRLFQEHALMDQAKALEKAFSEPMDPKRKEGFKQWLASNAGSHGSKYESRKSPANEFRRFLLYVANGLLHLAEAEAQASGVRRLFWDGAKLDMVSFALSSAPQKWVVGYLTACSAVDLFMTSTVQSKARYLKVFFETSVSFWLGRLRGCLGLDLAELESNRDETVRILEGQIRFWSGSVNRSGMDNENIKQAALAEDATPLDKQRAKRVLAQERTQSVRGGSPVDMYLVPKLEILREEAERMQRLYISVDFLKNWGTILEDLEVEAEAAPQEAQGGGGGGGAGQLLWGPTI